MVIGNLSDNSFSVNGDASINCKRIVSFNNYWVYVYFQYFGKICY